MTISRRNFIGAAMALPFVPGLARAQAAGGTIRYGLSGYPQNFEPWINAGAAQGAIKLMTQRGLLSYDKAGKLQGELAESWGADAKGNWTFKLRAGAKFHNGQAVTSADVVWCLQQVAAEQSTALMKPQFQSVAEFQAPDDVTVRLVMKAPNATVPTWFAVRELSIIPKGSSTKDPIGAGPFRIVASERGTSIDLEAFAGYYKPGMPKVKSIKVVSYADENLRLAAFQAGDIDIMDFVPWQSMDALDARPDATLYAQFGGIQLMQFNGAKGPIADARVRQAIAFSLRRDEIVKAAFFGKGQAIEGIPLFENAPGYDAALAKIWAYNPERAKALLSEAGFAGGFKSSILSTSSSGFEKTIAEVVQQQLAEIGIQCELNLPDQSTRNTLKNRGQFEIYTGGTVPNDTDPDSLTPSLTGSPGVAAPNTMATLAAGRAELDPIKRAANYKMMQEAALQEVPMVGLTWRTEGYGVRDTIKGFYVPPGPLLRNTQWCMEQVTVG